MIGNTRTILVKVSSCGRVLAKANYSTNFARSRFAVQHLKHAQTAQQFNLVKCNFATAEPGAATKLLESAKSVITDELKKEINAVFLFKISGKNYLMDAHESRPLKIEEVTAEPEKVDVTMITDETTFLKLAKGEVKPTTAFMTGKMKIKGDMGKAMKAQKIFKVMKV